MCIKYVWNLLHKTKKGIRWDVEKQDQPWVEITETGWWVHVPTLYLS